MTEAMAYLEALKTIDMRIHDWAKELLEEGHFLSEVKRRLRNAADMTGRK